MMHQEDQRESAAGDQQICHQHRAEVADRNVRVASRSRAGRMVDNSRCVSLARRAFRTDRTRIGERRFRDQAAPTRLRLEQPIDQCADREQPENNTTPRRRPGPSSTGSGCCRVRRSVHRSGRGHPPSEAAKDQAGRQRLTAGQRSPRRPTIVGDSDAGPFGAGRRTRPPIPGRPTPHSSPGGPGC